MKKYKRIVKQEIKPTYRDGRPVLFKIKNGTRKIIIKRDGMVCRYCGKNITINNYTIDHILPASKGGTEHPENLVMCCAGCNKRAKDLVFNSFEEKKEYLFVLAKDAYRNIAKNKKQEGR